MPEEKFLVCTEVSRKGPVVRGSLQDKCSECGEPIWVSPSSWLILHDNPGAKLICVKCVLAKLPANERPQVEAMTPAQEDEIREYFTEG